MSRHRAVAGQTTVHPLSSSAALHVKLHVAHSFVSGGLDPPPPNLANASRVELWNSYQPTLPPWGPELAGRVHWSLVGRLK